MNRNTKLISAAALLMAVSTSLSSCSNGSAPSASASVAPSVQPGNTQAPATTSAAPATSTAAQATKKVDTTTKAS